MNVALTIFLIVNISKLSLLWKKKDRFSVNHIFEYYDFAFYAWNDYF